VGILPAMPVRLGLSASCRNELSFESTPARKPTMYAIARCNGAGKTIPAIPLSA
jgi:hypothetical protein